MTGKISLDMIMVNVCLPQQYANYGSIRTFLFITFIIKGKDVKSRILVCTKVKLVLIFSSVAGTSENLALATCLLTCIQGGAQAIV